MSDRDDGPTETEREDSPAEAHESREGPERGPVPERPTDKEPDPGKGEGRKHGVQRSPEDQRAKPDPKQGE